MSRILKSPIDLPKGTEVKITDTEISVKGAKGNLQLTLNRLVAVVQDGEKLQVSAKDESRQARAIGGTTRSLIHNMIVGVNTGYSKKLELRGVGYRAKASGKSINLTLGFSHPIDYTLPEGITVETPSQTEIIVLGADKQKVGQVAAEIRDFRPPEPYKGKGVRYADEHVYRKEAKKK
ncbi:MAG: 50S ribosomal protein L6 [SAR86 cluster bacterium]|uniref:Large ribosomal subunit protein uL6 n=1 Tax=SAR86 cluster bacterium TaxID=2030880 RepID=A0A2A4MFL6_9GAMM|nr:MAG: 50S ribosomal protein L6 [SAR86 cluster bacterium]